MDIYDRERLSYLQREAANGDLTPREGKELAEMVRRLAKLAEAAGQVEGDPGEIRLADSADDVGTAHLAVRQVKRTHRLLAIPAVISLGLLAFSLLRMDVTIFLVAAFLTILSVVLIVGMFTSGKVVSVAAAEQQERRAEVAYARLHRRLPDAVDKALEARRAADTHAAIEAAKDEV